MKDFEGISLELRKPNRETKTYGDFFKYLEERIEDCECDPRDPLPVTRRFAEMHGLPFELLQEVLLEVGATCDCEVLANAVDEFPADAPMLEEYRPIENIAAENTFYAHCRVNGVPVPYSEAVAAAKSGKNVAWWVPCLPTDPHSMLDVNRALANRYDLWVMCEFY